MNHVQFNIEYDEKEHKFFIMQYKCEENGASEDQSIVIPDYQIDEFVKALENETRKAIR